MLSASALASYRDTRELSQLVINLFSHGTSTLPSPLPPSKAFITDIATSCLYLIQQLLQKWLVLDSANPRYPVDCIL
jgi:hypothetical protein